MKIPELLSPAGTLKNMRYAFAYGADAVYAGQPRYSLRVRNNDFNHLDNLALAITEAHAQNKQFYLACNIFPHNAKLKTFLADLKPVMALQPDALIMADPGLIMWVREHYPEIDIHLSVQMNTVNYAAVKFWKNIGLTRIILSRELSLDEIAEIRQQCPDMELEVFVHGALCIAYSGRCLLSGYMNHRDANQGSCTNACRWQYQVHPAQENAANDVIPLITQQKSESLYVLEEQQRLGEYMPIFEDEHGTYILNSKDLRAIQHVARLTEMGIDSIKIEGRTKSAYYVARTAQIYRQAIDDAVNNKSFNINLLHELDNLANRGYTEGFYRRHTHDEYQNYQTGNSLCNQQLFVGEVIKYDKKTNLVEIKVKNHFEVGDSLVFILPQGNTQFVLDHIEDLSGKSMTYAPGSGYTVRIPMPVIEGDLKVGLVARVI